MLDQDENIRVRVRVRVRAAAGVSFIDTVKVRAAIMVKVKTTGPVIGSATGTARATGRIGLAVMLRVRVRRILNFAGLEL